MSNRVQDIRHPVMRAAASLLQSKCICGTDFDVFFKPRPDGFVYYRFTAPNGEFVDGTFDPFKRDDGDAT